MLPTRPVLFIVPLIVILVLSLYYRDLYTKCTEIRQYRDALNDFLQSTDGSAQFRLVDFTDFSWDTVRIVTGLKAAPRSLECPLDWNWKSGERESLVSSGLLTAVIFGRQDSIVRYLELRGDEVAFRGVDSILESSRAVFKVDRQAGSGGVTLVLEN